MAKKSVTPVSRCDAFFLCPSVRRSLPEGWWFSHVHVRTTDFVSRSRSAGSPLRSAPNLLSLLAAFSRPVPLGFCCGGFSSTAGYVPGNEARVLPFGFRERRGTRWLIISMERYPFLSEQLRLAFRLTLASLSASAPDVPDSGFPLLLSSSGCVTASAPPSGAGQSALEQPRL